MAEVITRFKLETTQYDSALRDAANSLSKLSGQLAMAGKDFDKFAQKSVDQARALGQIESGATNVKDKLRDLVNAYNNVAKAYNNLTNEQKQTDFGKAMSQSLQELQGRIKDTKQEMSSMTQSSGGLRGVLDSVAQKFGLNISQLTKFGGALAATGAAIKVSTDAFMSMESNVDEWGRTIESSQSIYETFLQSLNNSDFSGFLSRISEVIQKARDAYDAMDELNTRGGIVSTERVKLQARQTELKAIIRREGKDSKAGKEAQQALKDLEPKLQESYKTEAKLNYNAFKAEVDRKLSTAGIKLDKASYDYLMRSFSSDATFHTMRKNARGELKTEYQYSDTTGDVIGSKVVDTRNLNKKLMDLFTDEWRNTYRPYLNSMYSARGAAASSMLGDARYINGGRNGSGSGSQLTDLEKAQQKFEQAQKDYQQALEQAALEVKAGTADTVAAKKKELSAAENLWKSIGDAREIYDSEELKKAQEDAAKKVVELGGSVNALIEEQKKAQEAARELTAAQKKAAEANRKMADALAANDYKAYTTAQKQYNAAQAEVKRLQPQVQTPDIEPVVFEVETRTEAALEELKAINGITLDDKTMTVTADTKQAVDALSQVEGITLTPKKVEVQTPDIEGIFSYTDNNLSAFIGNLKQELSQAPLGSELYKNLTAQLADANMLANLMQTAVKNGIDAAQFDPQTLFNEIFGENPGDYIDDAKWQEIRKKIEEIIGKPITIDVNTGTVNVENAKGKSAEKGKSDYNKIVGSMSTITGALQQLGVEVPEGFSKTLGILQVISTITMAIQSLAAVTATTSALKAIPIIGWFLHNGGVVHAANGYSVPGNHYSNDMVPAMLNSGELVLNKAQQGNLASQLQDGGNGGNVGRSMATIESDQIRIVLQNGAQAKGMTLGEYLGLN